MSGILLKSKGEENNEDEMLMMMKLEEEEELYREGLLDDDDELGDLLNDEDIDLLISNHPCNTLFL